jgi:Domain of unknown function (DUF4124)
MRFTIHAMAFASLTAFTLPASAEVLYKLIDKNGKVTYSETKPKTFDGQVIRIDIDPNANTATLPKGQPAAGEGALGRRPNDGSAKKVDAEARLAQARERLEGAKKALQDARDNPADGDMQILGNKGGGVRMIPTEAYQQRLAALEAQVKSAEEELQLAEKDL